MYSLEAQARRERATALEKEREEVGLALRDTRSRVNKYDRLKKKIKTKVHTASLSLLPSNKHDLGVWLLHAMVIVELMDLYVPECTLNRM